MRRATAWVACALLAAASPALGQDPWSMVRTENLTLVGDQPGGRLHEIGAQLEAFRLAVGRVISNASRPPALPTVVVVLGTRRTMQRYLPPDMAGSGIIAGYFRQDRDINRIVLSLEGFTQSPQVAYHEYTHLLLRGTMTSPPPWLEEGIAEYFGRLGAAPTVSLRQPWMPVADLIAFSGGATTLAHDNATAAAFYRQAALLVHFILTQHASGGAAINRYLALVTNGHAPATAFEEAFGTTPRAMDERLRAYAGSGEMPSRRVSLPRPAATREPAPDSVLSPAETRAWQGEVLRSVGWPEGAAEVEAAAVMDPESAMVQVLLGRTRLATGDAPGGHAALTLGADRGPDDFLAQFWKGFWFVQAGAPAEEAGAAVRALRRATALRPASADAHALLAEALLAGTPASPRAAAAAIERALALAPERLEFMLIQAHVLLRLDQPDAARGVLRVLAGVDHDSRLASRARELLARLDARNRP